MSLVSRVAHAIPGRLRLKLKHKNALSPSVLECSSLPGVLLVRANPACSSIIIQYDIGLTDQKTIMELFQTTPATLPLLSPQDITSACACSPSQETSPVRKQLIRFLGLTGVVGYIFFKEILLKIPLAQAATSPLGVIALIASFPLFKDSLRHAQKKRFTLEGFLAAGCAIATLSGQAITALEILWIQSGAETLNAWVAERSRRSVASILDMTAKNTFILAGGVEVEVPVSAVKVRDIVVLHTGEKISIDGTVIHGSALVDDSPITGRAELAHISEGEKVYAGSYVHQGIIHVRAECVGDKTYLSRIMSQVESSLENRAPIESVADKLAKSMLLLGIAATAGTLVFTGSLWRSFTVMLVMACPCATVLSAQTAVSAAMAAAARKGILIKGGRYLEAIGTADTICFDKTGTLTTSEPRIDTIVNFSHFPESQLLQWAYSAEVHNHHPLAQAIKKEAQTRNIDPISHLVCDFTLGKGVRAVIGQDEIRLGNRRYLQEAAIDTEHLLDQTDSLEERGLTVIFLAKNKNVLAALGFANEPRPDALRTINSLRSSGVKHISMVTGDSKQTALDLCRLLHIDECRHSVLPEEKGKIIKELRDAGKRVVMVGDGINDALALAEADIGIAMSANGSDVAIEAADIALVRDDLADILYVRELSRKTIRTAKQNFWLATSTNIGGAVAGAFGLVSPVTAGIIHIVHTLGVLANSSRLMLPPAKTAQISQKPSTQHKETAKYDD